VPEYLQQLSAERFGDFQTVQLFNSNWRALPDRLDEVGRRLWQHNLEVGVNNLVPLHLGELSTRRARPTAAPKTGNT